MFKIYLALISFFSLLTFQSTATQKEFYQLKIYHIKTAQQEEKVDAFLKQAYLPALHRAGITKVGVFKPIYPTDVVPTEKLIYVFVPFRSFDGIAKLEQQLVKDQTYHIDGKSYLEAVYTEPPYERLEIILMNAFDGHPKFTMPQLTSPLKDRVYELRSYESHTEAIAKNKIEMFNKGDEIGLFKRLNFNAVFYAEVVAGSRMPNLMYLTTFENKADRDAHWKAFGADAFWKTLSALAQYKNNVSKNDTKFISPTEYSDI
ncbi:NIPSNAP family containing protein [Pedobacter frigiditerrae]|uniref:NIPSNAP family containing protein n=1 Tax=Pedobacter frigiditerrae TaxID=2530452 RepID=A0A4R0MUB3_9SPHI|nr:NIPSNAP family protein [Pedobacter frigiditerrae]TCC90327.1 NIPSNAP family containing protein [Pedobacter frigiditerrae]